MTDQIHPHPPITDDPARHETVVAEGVSFDDFLKQYAEVHAEWLTGKVILIGSKRTQHQLILGVLSNLVSYFLGFKNLGLILSAGVPMFIDNDLPAREPDLLVVLNEHRERIKTNRIEGPADIAVEIVSSESSKRDRGDKMDEYELAGVREYWLIDPLRHEASIYELGAEGRYHRRALDEQGHLTSGVLAGFTLDPALLWQDDLPAGPAFIELVQQMMGDAV